MDAKPPVWRVLQLGVLCSVLLLLLLGVGTTAPTPGPDATTGEAYFFAVPGAKDCAFDNSRQRLYVTTPKQLVVLDAKKRTTVDAIDLNGDVRACDISPDAKYLAVAPSKSQSIYWISLDGLEVTQVKFKADPSETGVFDLCVGADNSVLLSTTFAGSGFVKLRRFDPRASRVEVVGRVNMNTVVTASSGDRNFAALAEGNISSGPVKLYDFKAGELKPVVDMNGFHYEFACAREGKFLARPHAGGCDLYDGSGGRLGTLPGRAVIGVAFHPKADRLFVMRHGEKSIQEYDVESQSLTAEYPLDKALVIKGDVKSRVVGTVIDTGRNTAIANFRNVRSVHFRTFESGRLKVSDSGDRLCAVIPTGVYVFPVKAGHSTPGGADTPPKRRIKVINTD